MKIQAREGIRNDLTKCSNLYCSYSIKRNGWYLKYWQKRKIICTNCSETSSTPGLLIQMGISPETSLPTSITFIFKWYISKNSIVAKRGRVIMKKAEGSECAVQIFFFCLRSSQSSETYILKLLISVFKIIILIPTSCKRRQTSIVSQLSGTKERDSTSWLNLGGLHFHVHKYMKSLKLPGIRKLKRTFQKLDAMFQRIECLFP